MQHQNNLDILEERIMDIKRKIKQAANIMGIEKLRKSQVKPINDILEGRDTMVVARPSAGKSAIYQIPYAYSFA